jgi:hypothetical protein
MDYFQGVVTDYIRANRATFVNTECCIQLNPGANPDHSGPHWYCDALAVNLEVQRAYLCEISFAKKLAALRGRLLSWEKNWSPLRQALLRDCGIPLGWKVQPWLFIPKDLEADFQLASIAPVEDASSVERMPVPRITHLEDVLPWKYKSWHRDHTDVD